MASREGTSIEPFLNPLTGKAEEVRAIVEPTIDGMGCELVHMHFVKGQRRTLLRLFIDRKPPERGIGLDTLAVLNRTLGDLLDVEDEARGLFHGTWDLEVSSPGLDRPLAKRSHFQQAVGERAKLRTGRVVAGRKAHTGRLDGADDAGVTLTADDQEPIFIPWDDVEEAHVVFVFDAPRSASPKTGPKAASPRAASSPQKSSQQKSPQQKSSQSGAKAPSKKAKRA